MANHLVIMAGGIGSRFWPMSTPTCPKQFLDIMGCGRTMIQQTFDRFGSLIDLDHVWVVTSKNFQALVSQQLQGINPQHILLEPCMRNTAPCIAYVSWKIQREDPDAAIFVAASDHLVTDPAAFQRCVAQGIQFIQKGDRILTLGMQPTRPETGYGYIEQGEALSTDAALGDKAIYQLAAFREKPDLTTAQQYLATGRYTWNSGMFLWSVKTIVNELRQHAPEIAAVMDQIAPSLFTDQEQAKVDELYPTFPKISIDYAVMEKTKLAYVMPSEFGWSDLGTWGSLHTLLPQDADGNAVVGDQVKVIESSGCMVRVPNGKQVVIQGLDDVIVSEHNGVLLICKLSDEQRIKEWHD
ncbi:MAG: mannose-1-phosphate guanylyltransferase [Bacteroidales bacterium]|nr:mannose-1-phosphate guanylyltransferase [Bacteroidales bacterium]